MQKPADLEGCCPFLNVEESCRYGITCRFLNTHKENSLSESLAPYKKSHEINNLNKDLQRLLWKNKVNFPKADAQLKLLGLKVCTKLEDLDSVRNMSYIRSMGCIRSSIGLGVGLGFLCIYIL